jgi:multidrug resistance efflux pump
MTMTTRWLSLLPRLTTAAMVILAIVVLHRMWSQYEMAPWTRDGRVRADVVGIAPDVSGWVVRVCVTDDQVVHRGDPLFEIDRTRYVIAVQQSEAAVARQRAALAEAQREARRNGSLGDLVASEAREQSQARLEEASAQLQGNLADLAVARLNLQRTVVVAPVNGVVTNLELRPGNYLTPGHEALALVDSDSLHVDGYFEETKLPQIHVGDRVAVNLMGQSQRIYGRIQGIAPAIEDRERSPTSHLVANINPSFTWVRLAQRVPVRIKLDPAPVSVALIAGRTATIVDLSYQDPASGKHRGDLP